MAGSESAFQHKACPKYPATWSLSLRDQQNTTFGLLFYANLSEFKGSIQDLSLTVGPYHESLEHMHKPS